MYKSGATSCPCMRTYGICHLKVKMNSADTACILEFNEMGGDYPYTSCPFYALYAAGL